MRPGGYPESGTNNNIPVPAVPTAADQALQSVLGPLCVITEKQQACLNYLTAYKQTLNVARSGSIAPDQLERLRSVASGQTQGIQKEVHEILENLKLVFSTCNGLDRFGDEQLCSNQNVFDQIIARLNFAAQFLHRFLADPALSANSDILNGERPQLAKALGWIKSKSEDYSRRSMRMAQSRSTRGQISGADVELSGFFGNAPSHPTNNAANAAQDFSAGMFPSATNGSRLINSNFTYGGHDSKTQTGAPPQNQRPPIAPADDSSLTKASDVRPQPVKLNPREKLEEETGIIIIGELGRGGMGVVYDAIDNLGREVALKQILNPDPEMIIRHKKEAESTAKLSEKTRGVPRVHQYFKFMGSWWYTQEKEPGAKEYSIHPEQIARILFKNENVQNLMELKDAFDNLHDFQTQHQDLMIKPDKQKEKIELISAQQLGTLLDYAMKKAITPEQTEQLGRLRLIITHNKNKQHYSIHEANLNKPLKEGLKILHRTLLQMGAVVTETEEERNKRVKNKAKGPGTLKDYLKLLNIHNGAMSGSDAQKVMQLLREVCGEKFPEKEVYDVMKYFNYDLLRTMGHVEQEGVLHRDIKPANVLLSSRGADIWLYLVDHMLYLATENLEDWEFQERLKEVISKAKEMCHETVFEEREPLMKVIDFGLVKSQGVVDLKRGRAQQVAPPSSSDPELTTSGQTLGTVAYIPPELLTPTQPEDDQSRRDTYATGILLTEIFTGKKLMPSKPTIVTLMTDIMCLGTDADAYRDAKRKGNKKAKKTPLSAIDLNTDFVKFLQANDPEMLKALRKMTKLTANEDERKPIRFAEVAEQIEESLRPSNERSKWLNLAYAGVSAVVVTLALAGTWSWYEGYKLKQEAQGIVAKLDGDLESMDLRDSKYTSDYFAERIEEIERVRQIYGEGINPELDKRLGEMEKWFGLMGKLALSKEKYDVFMDKFDRRSDPSVMKEMNSAALCASDFWEEFSDSGFEFKHVLALPGVVPDTIHDESTDLSLKVEYVKNLKKSYESDLNMFVLKCGDLVFRSYEHRSQEEFRSMTIYEHLDSFNNLILWTFIVKFHKKVINEPEKIRKMPTETRILAMHIIMLGMEKFDNIFRYKEENPNAEQLSDLQVIDIDAMLSITSAAMKDHLALCNFSHSDFSQDERPTPK